MYTLLRVENDRRAVCKINIKIIFGIPIHCIWTTIINCYIDIYIYIYIQYTHIEQTCKVLHFSRDAPVFKIYNNTCDTV